jgi:hypothetical protein
LAFVGRTTINQGKVRYGLRPLPEATKTSAATAAAKKSFYTSRFVISVVGGLCMRLLRRPQSSLGRGGKWKKRNDDDSLGKK